MSKGDVAAGLEAHWHAYDDGTPDWAFAIAEDVATLGNPCEYVQKFAFWSGRRRHAFWLIPQAAQ